MKKPLLIALLALLIAPFAVQAQNCYPAPANGILEGLYQKENIPNRKPVSYPPLREADVMWAKRVWRRIDLREKLNHSLYFPERPSPSRISLFDVLRCGILETQTITAYDPGPLGLDDMFTMPLTAQGAFDKIRIVDTVYTDDPDSGESMPVVVDNSISSRDIVAYDIKEDWFFDKQRSVMDVRIIGICPMVARRDETTGEFRGLKPLFWVYFPAARQLLAQNQVYNRHNDLGTISYDDLFWKRMFASVIIQESNVYGRSISEYRTGIDALLEADRIKDGIFIMEHDLWSY